MGVKISLLPEAVTPLSGGELIAVTQAGGSVKATVQKIVELALAQEAGGTGTEPDTDRLSNLLDVLITSPTDGEVLTYDSGLAMWVNAPAGGGEATGTSTALQLDDVVPIFDFTAGHAYGGAGEESAFIGNIPATPGLGALANLGEKVEAWFGGILSVTGTQIKVYVGGTLVFGSSAISCTPTAAFLVTLQMIRDSATTVRVFVQCCVNGVASIVGWANPTVTFSGLIPIDIRFVGGTIPAFGDVTLEAASGKWVPRA